MDLIKENIAITSFLSLLGAGYLFHQYSLTSSSSPSALEKSETIPRPYPIRVKSLFIYPVKSLGGIEVRSIKLGKFGIENDRRWVLVKGGIWLSQKTFPKMATIVPSFSFDGKQLVLSCQGEPDLLVSAEPLTEENIDKSKISICKFIRDSGEVYDCGDEASEWFSRVLGSPDIRLCQMPPSYYRPIRQSIRENLDENNQKHEMSYSNSAPVMMLSQASIDEISIRVDQTRANKGEVLTPPLTWDRFRPTILITGTFPFEEDQFLSVKFNNKDNVVMTFGDNNARCPIVTIDQTKGSYDPTDEPQRTLHTFREVDCDLGKKTLVGMYTVYDEQFYGSEIQVGNVIDVLQRGFKSKYFKNINIQEK